MHKMSLKLYCIPKQRSKTVIFLYLVNLFDELLKLIFLETGHSCILFFKFACARLIKTAEDISSSSSVSLVHGIQDIL